MNYWLMKSEPESFSIADLKARPKKTGHWDGVRNYQARNFMRAVKKGDLAAGASRQAGAIAHALGIPVEKIIVLLENGQRASFQEKLLLV